MSEQQSVDVDIEAPEKGKRPKATYPQPVMCPICDVRGEVIHVKKSLFQVKEYAIDLYPVSYQWSLRNVDPIEPRHFFVAHCKSCRWSWESSSFVDPGEGLAVPTKVFVEAIQRNRFDKNIGAVLSVLGEGTSYGEGVVTAFDAVRFHLLALFAAQEVPGLIEREPTVVARLALRTAWLIREVSSDEEADDFNRLVRDMEVIREQGYQLPFDESFWLGESLKLYGRGLTASRLVETVSDEVEILYLMTRLALKLGKFPDAKKHFALAKAKIRNFEQQERADYDKQRRAGVADADKVHQQAVAEVRRLTYNGEKLQQIYDDRAGAWEEKVVAEAHVLCSQRPSLHGEALQAYLVERGIEESIAQKVVGSKKPQKGGVLKKLFG